MSKWVKENNQTKLIHISTDHVYSGLGPHTEKNIKPVNNYAKSKLKAERYLSDVNSCILRTNFLVLKCKNLLLIGYINLN